MPKSLIEFMESQEVEQTDEALTHSQRIKASNRQARIVMMKKLTKGAGKDELSFSRRTDIEKRLAKKSAVIARLAKKMIPAIRKQDRERKANKGKDDK